MRNDTNAQRNEPNRNMYAATTTLVIASALLGAAGNSMACDRCAQWSQTPALVFTGEPVDMTGGAAWDVDSDGSWVGRVRFALASPGGTRLKLDDFDLPEGSSVSVFDGDSPQPTHEWTAQAMSQRDSAFTPMLFGAEARFEMRVAPDSQDLPAFSVSDEESYFVAGNETARLAGRGAQRDASEPWLEPRPLAKDWCQCADHTAAHDPDNKLAAPGIRKWTGGVVPYTFGSDVSSSQRWATEAAMSEVSKVTAIRFVRWSGEQDYLHIFNGGGNWSYLGRRGGRQELSMYNWSYRYIIIHELMHALGLHHHHSRSNRDQYIKVNFQNVVAGYEPQFHKKNTNWTGPYNFESVMHYSPCGFNYCGSCSSCPTISVRDQYSRFSRVIGQRSYLSEGDIATLVNMYGGPAPTDDRFEPNNRFGHSMPLGVGTHSLMLLDDDFFWFQANTTGRFTVTIQRKNGLDAELAILDDIANVKTQTTSGSTIRSTSDSGFFGIRVRQRNGSTGAYTLTLEFERGLKTDINRDGRVDADDLMAVLKDWGQSCSGGSGCGDVDGDGFVYHDDLGLVLKDMGYDGSNMKQGKWKKTMNKLFKSQIKWRVAGKENKAPRKAFKQILKSTPRN